MRVLVVGATGGSGRAAVEALTARGHEVTAFARRAGAAFREDASRGDTAVRTVDGDATRPADVGRAVRGQDAVVVALGISEHPLVVRLRGSRGTPMDVRSRGTAALVAAMREHGVPRLVVQSSYGVGETRDRLPLSSKLVFALLLRPQIVDHERQERVVRDSGLDWTIVQPVYLTDGDEAAATSPAGDVQGMHVSRRAVGGVLADLATRAGDAGGRCLAVSGAAAPAAGDPAPSPLLGSGHASGDHERTRRTRGARLG
ncbi:NAD(P)-dependent oxidoreductase [Geodermatophilus nigrescens]|uniref:NAD(P)H-binding n=1 Tax=Geodermatophilus nigrescens TaxID=1070870 RepID=A0A1M5CWJ6_9ACTN|nr:NAD(P)-binding oxidoreductase [Geodermatophilus nigrescens]SHF58927.1 NAD(P)H-binding [Geodermatophilus nigrescens]